MRKKFVEEYPYANNPKRNEVPLEDRPLPEQVAQMHSMHASYYQGPRKRIYIPEDPRRDRTEREEYYYKKNRINSYNFQIRKARRQIKRIKDQSQNSYLDELRIDKLNKKIEILEKKAESIVVPDYEGRVSGDCKKNT